MTTVPNPDAHLEALLRYLGGFGEPPKVQQSDAPSDPQLIQLKGWLHSHFNALDNTVSVVDFGLGSGVLIQTFAALPGFLSRRHRYIGVDLSITEEMEKQVSDLAKSQFEVQLLSRGQFFSETLPPGPPVRLIVLRNVLHEIPLHEIAVTFYQLARHTEPGATILIQDMILLPEGEFEAITWDENDLRAFLPPPFFSVNTLTQVSKRGIVWILAEVRVLEKCTQSLSVWRKRCIDGAHSKIKKIGLEIDNWYGTRKRGDNGILYAHLNHMYTKLSRELASSPAEFESIVHDHALDIGGLTFPVAVLEGDGTRIFEKDMIKCELHSEPYHLPSVIASVQPTLIEEHERRARAERKILFNGRHFRLSDLSYEVLDVETEEKRLVLHLNTCTYYDYICTNLSLDKNIIITAEGAVSPRAFFRSDPLQLRESPLANQLGLNLSVVTRRDQRVLYSRRSDRAFAYSSGYANAINAEISGGDTDNGTPDPFLAAVREANEELGLELKVADIKILALVRNLETFQPDLVGFVEVDQSANDLIRTAAICARDKFEYTHLLSLPMDVQSLAKHLSEHNRDWVPQCAASLVFLMVHCFGFSSVKAALGGTQAGIFRRDTSFSYKPPIRGNIREYVTKTIKRTGAIGNVLDVGSGYRGHVENLVPILQSSTLQSLDLNPNSGADILSDAANMKSVPSSSISCAICTELLEHVPDPRKVLSEIARILCPGGRIILSVPFAVALHGKVTQPDLWRFTPEGLRVLLEEHFQSIDIETAGDPAAPTSVFGTAVVKK